MNALHFSEAAQNDLIEIKEYVEKELLNPTAATATVRRILSSLQILQTFAEAGAPLSSVVDIESAYRYIISGNYVSFYRTHENNVYIDRILYCRRDFMRVLFDTFGTEN